jgi:hypothetical protein
MSFNQGKPAAATSLRASNPEILANNAQLQTAINNEHIFSGTDSGTQTGDHTQGSARCFSQASAPATRIDGNGFLSTDLGSLWVDTDDNAVYVLTATTPTWTPVSTEIIATLLAANRIFGGTLGVTGDFDVNTDKFTVAATTGNTAVAGTLDIASTIPITAMLDEDDLVSDSDTAVASQQSIKKFVEDSIDSAVKHSVDGVQTEVLTKYLTGTTDNDGTTSVAHGITGADNILSVSASIFSTNTTNYTVTDFLDSVSTQNNGWNLQYNSINVVFSTVETAVQGNNYRIKIDYIVP